MSKLFGVLSASFVYFCIGQTLAVMVLVGAFVAKGHSHARQARTDHGRHARSRSARLAASDRRRSREGATCRNRRCRRWPRRARCKSRDLELREQELRNQLNLIRQEQSKLDRRSGPISTCTDRLRAAAEEPPRRSDRDELGKRPLILENMKPKQAKEQIQKMLDDGEMKQAVVLMSAMPIEKRAKIVTEFKTDEGIGRAGRDAAIDSRRRAGSDADRRDEQELESPGNVIVRGETNRKRSLQRGPAAVDLIHLTKLEPPAPVASAASGERRRVRRFKQHLAAGRTTRERTTSGRRATTIATNERRTAERTAPSRPTSETARKPTAGEERRRRPKAKMQPAVDDAGPKARDTTPKARPDDEQGRADRGADRGRRGGAGRRAPMRTARAEDEVHAHGRSRRSGRRATTPREDRGEEGRARDGRRSRRPRTSRRSDAPRRRAGDARADEAGRSPRRSKQAKPVGDDDERQEANADRASRRKCRRPTRDRSTDRASRRSDRVPRRRGRRRSGRQAETSDDGDGNGPRSEDAKADEAKRPIDARPRTNDAQSMRAADGACRRRRSRRARHVERRQQSNSSDDSRRAVAANADASRRHDADRSRAPATNRRATDAAARRRSDARPKAAKSTRRCRRPIGRGSCNASRGPCRRRKIAAAT